MNNGIIFLEKTMNVLKQVYGRANKIFLAGVLLLAVAAGISAQTGRLGQIAILPFSGGTASEREGIAELFSYTQVMMDSFGVMPRTSITRAAENEQAFQANSGMTSADTIARLGNQFGAEYVMAGSITQVGTQNLLIVSIVKIDVIRQVAGDFLLYDSLDALNRDGAILDRMAANLVKMAREQDDRVEKLALLPVEFTDGVNKQEGDALAQLLAIYLLRYNAYAVYPRTKTLDQVQSEYETQLGGATRGSEAVVAGRADNPPFVLSVVSRKIGTGTQFNAAIIDLEGGEQIAFKTEQYSDLQDGIDAIEFLARELSGQEVSARERGRRTSSIERSAAQARRTESWNNFWNTYFKNSGITFHALGGIMMTGTGSKSVPKKETDTQNTTPDATKDEDKMGSVPSGSFFLNAELRPWRYFGIQTGINIVGDFIEYIPSSSPDEPGTYDTLQTIQLPILARVSIPLGDYFHLVGLGGVALNLNTMSSDAVSLEPASTSFIVGGGAGFRGKNFEFFVGFMYNGDIDEGTATYKSVPDPVSYQRGHGGIFFNLGYFVPFRKNSV
jgi:hypothetical protein